MGEDFCVAYACEATFEGGKSANMTYAPKMSFTLAADGGEAQSMSSDYFKLLIAYILRFFNEGSVSFDTNETLKVMKLREAVVREVGRL